jgi:hypothetical protein
MRALCVFLSLRLPAQFPDSESAAYIVPVELRLNVFGSAMTASYCFGIAPAGGVPLVAGGLDGGAAYAFFRKFS